MSQLFVVLLLCVFLERGVFWFVGGRKINVFVERARGKRKNVFC